MQERTSLQSLENTILIKRKAMAFETFEKGCYYSEHSSDSDSPIEKRNRYTPVFKMKLARLAKYNVARDVGDTYRIPFLNVRKWCTQYKKYGPGSFFPDGKVPYVKRELITPRESPTGSPNSKNLEAEAEKAEEMKELVPKRILTQEEIQDNTITIYDYDTQEYTGARLRLLAAKDALDCGSTAKVGKAIGVHKATVRRWLKVLREQGEGAELFTIESMHSKPHVHYSQEMKIEAAIMALNESCKVVGKRFGVPHSTVSTWKLLYTREGSKGFY